MKEQLLTLRIDWRDMDLLGHVNNLAIVSYFQSARVLFSESIGLAAYPGMELGPIEAATQVQFTKQLRYPGQVTVHTTLIEIKNTSFIIEHRIVDDAGDVAAVGREVIVCFDFVKQVKTPIPEAVRAKLEARLPETKLGSSPCDARS